MGSFDHHEGDCIAQTCPVHGYRKAKYLIHAVNVLGLQCLESNIRKVWHGVRTVVQGRG